MEARRIFVDIIRENPEARAARSNREGVEGERLATIARRNLALLDAKVQTDDALNGLAVGHMDRGDWLFAGIYADAALSLNQGDPYAALNRGAVAAHDGETGTAAHYLDRAAELGKTAKITRSNEAAGAGRTVAQLAMENRENLPASTTAPRETWPATGARFATLRRLRDRGLVTPEEYARRRDANLAAVLPGSEAPPPVSGGEAESLLIKLLSRYQLGDLSAEEYGALRAIVLDRVLPAAPLPALPGGQAGTDGLDRLRSAGVITDDERAGLAARLPGSSGARDRMTGDSAAGDTNGAPAMMATVSQAPAPMPPATLEPVAFSGSRLGVQLASYRKPENARTGWEKLQVAGRGALDGLEPAIVRIDLGRGLGVFYRLYAGEVDSLGAAQRICTQMQAQGLDCVVGRY